MRHQLIKYKLSEVSNHFTGIAKELIPAVDFEKKDKVKLNLSDLWNSFVGIKSQLIQILLVSLALEIFEIITPFFTQLITDDVIVAKDFSLLYVLAIGLALLILTKAISSFVRSWIILYVSNTINVQLVATLIRHLFKLPLGLFENRLFMKSCVQLKLYKFSIMLFQSALLF